MTFMACIGKRFSDAGLQDILIESELVATGSVNGVCSGHHCNHSVRSHKIICQALQRLWLEDFIETLPDEEQDLVFCNTAELQAAFPKEFDTLVQSEGICCLLKSYADFVKKNNKQNLTFQYWSSSLR